MEFDKQELSTIYDLVENYQQELCCMDQKEWNKNRDGLLDDELNYVTKLLKKIKEQGDIRFG